MKKAVQILYVLLFITLLYPLAARAEDAPPFTITGSVDVYAGYNFNDPKSMTNGPGTNNFAIYTNSFSLSMAEVVIQRAPAPVGFRIDLDFGPTADFVHCGTVNCDPTTNQETTFKNVQQAYVTWATPVKATVDMGVFVTHMGLEVIESQLNWNYTRSLLFCCAIPYYHSGVRVNYPINDMVFVNGYLLNGWNDVIETNHMKTWGAQVGITPIKQVPILLNWIGPEEAAGVYTDRQVYEAIATYNATDKLAFALNYDYGSQKIDVPGPTFDDTQKWSGIALYGRYQITDANAVAVRYENTDDSDGIMFGTTDNKVSEFTITGEHKIGGNLLTRVEYRNDMSDKKIYEDKDGAITKDTQGQVVLGVVYTF